MTKKHENVQIQEAPKRVRSDRSEKLIARKSQSETVVKSCLRSRISLNDLSKKAAILSAIRERVEVFSKRVHIASLAFNLLVRRAFHDIEDDKIHKVPLPEGFFSQTFAYQLMLGTDSSEKPFHMITDVYAQCSDLTTKLGALPRHLADRNIYASGAIRFKTNIKNHLVTNLPKMMKKFIYSPPIQDSLKASQVDNKLPVNWIKDASRAIIYSLNNWKLTTKDLDILAQLPAYVAQEMWRHKLILGPDMMGEAWLKKEESMERILRYFVFMNRFLGANDLKLCNLLPISKIRSHYMTLDTHSFYGVMADAKIIDPKKCPGSTFVDLGKDHWASTFNVSPIKGKNATFTGTMDTDGIASTFHFVRPKKVAKAKPVGRVEKEAALEKLSEELQRDPTVDIVAIDPGRSNIIYAVKLVDKKPKEFVLTRNQYYTESGIFTARRHTEDWHRGIQPSLKALSEASSKGADKSVFLAYLKVVMEHYDVFWSEYLKPRWANQRLRLYGGKKKTFAKFFNRMEEGGRKIVIAYGSAKYAPGGKNEISVPTSRAFKECSYRFPTFAVDEFRTTRIYNGDHTTVLQDIKRKDTSGKVRGLLWCCSTNQRKSKYVNRDLNAALNIRDCFISRPNILTRSTEQKKLEVIVGRTIRCKKRFVGRCWSQRGRYIVIRPEQRGIRL